MRIHDKEPKLFIKILKAKAKSEAPSFPSLTSVQRNILQEQTKITKGGKNKLSQRSAPRPKVRVEIFLCGVDQAFRATFGAEDGDDG